VRQHRRPHAGGGLLRNLRRGLAGQDREFVERAALLAFQRGHRRAGLVENGARAGDIEVGTGAEVALTHGQVIDVLHHFDGTARHVGFLAEGAGVGIGAGGFSRDIDADEVFGGGGRLGVGARGFDGAADAAEQVEVVGHRERAVETGRRFRFQSLQRGDQIGRRTLAVGRARLDLGRGEASGARALQHGQRLFQVGGGNLQVAVLGQRLADQVVQHRIVVELPPIAG
jgi:hypothetical protein